MNDHLALLITLIALFVIAAIGISMYASYYDPDNHISNQMH